jgi:hypothetical protein
MKPADFFLIFIMTVGLQAAEPVSDTSRRLGPLDSMAAARQHFGSWKYPFAIATNTPAFEVWGLEFMLQEANTMREQWRLDIPDPLTVNHVYFAVYPSADGLTGKLLTRDGRFFWDFDRNTLFSFWDTNYFAPSFRYHDDESARLTKIKSQITKKEAEAIARDALQKLLGVDPQQLGLKKRAEVNQYKFEESDGKVYPLPLFDVRWRVAGPKRYAAENLESTPLYMEISGVTKTVAKYEHPQRLRMDSPVPRWPIPTNYFQMLGLADNYLDTVPERKRRLWGLPPATNAPVDATNSYQPNVGAGH